MWYVYVLRSLVNHRLYTGSTNDIKRRLKEHNSGRSKYTKSTKPFKLVYQEKYEARVEARRREMFLKSGRGRDFLRKLIKGT